MGINQKRFERFVYCAHKMKMIIANDKYITDRELSQRLGIAFSELQEVKHFCIINKMKVNQPNPNPVKKDVRKALK